MSEWTGGVIGFLGVPGTGKTFLMARCFWPARRVVVLSFANGFAPPESCRDNQNPLPGFIFVYSVPELVDALQKSGSGPVRVCFKPLRVSGKLWNVFDGVSQLVADFSEKYGQCVYAVDEVWNGQRPDASPDGWRECYAQWRHYGVVPMWTAQVPGMTDARMRSMSTELYIGQVVTELDLKAVRGAGVHEDAIKLLPTLPRRTFVHKFENGSWRIEKS